jgi:prolyl-tRNA editing enzyme YbaK/EbsC (Cys-tRNA(Pro) deacylase)
VSEAPRSGSVARVEAALQVRGLTPEIVEVPASARTSAGAAEAIGCTVAQIAKSLVFRLRDSDRPVLVIASGVNRVDEGKVAEHLGEAIGRADPAFVRETTGFAIGGVAPLGHLAPLTTLLDRSLLDHAEIWAAAGAPNAVFRLRPEQLPELTGGRFVDVKVD